MGGGWGDEIQVNLPARLRITTTYGFFKLTAFNYTILSYLDLSPSPHLIERARICGIEWLRIDFTFRQSKNDSQNKRKKKSGTLESTIIALFHNTIIGPLARQLLVCVSKHTPFCIVDSHKKKTSKLNIILMALSVVFFSSSFYWNMCVHCACWKLIAIYWHPEWKIPHSSKPWDNEHFMQISNKNARNKNIHDETTHLLLLFLFFFFFGLHLFVWRKV